MSTGGWLTRFRAGIRRRFVRVFGVVSCGVLAHDNAVVGYAAWDDPKDTAATLEPFLKPVALESESVGGSVEYRMTLTVGD